MGTPSFAESIRQAVAKAVLALHTAMPGRVVSYDAATQTADVQPLLKWAQFLPGRVREVADLPVLPDVLVCFPRAGSLGIHLPLAAGDLVLLVFCSRSLTSWRGQSSGGTVTDPARVFTPTPLEAAVALPLMTHDSAPLGTALASGSTINVGSGSGTFEAVAQAEKVATQLTALKNAISGAAVGTSDGGATLKANILAALASWPGSVAATNVKVS